MSASGIEKKIVRTTDEAIEQIKRVRNNLIVSVMVSPEAYLPLFNVVSISAVRLEFMKRDLLELQKSSLDLVHYATLIKAMKDDPALECSPDELLIQEELQQVVSRYQ